MEKLQDIMDAVVAGNIAETKEGVRQALSKGATPTDVMDKGMVAGLDLVGEQNIVASLIMGLSRQPVTLLLYNVNELPCLSKSPLPY